MALSNEEIALAYREGYDAPAQLGAAGVEEWMRLAELNALQGVAQAVAADCAITARAMADNESDGYYGQACYEVARMISATYGVSE